MQLFTATFVKNKCKFLRFLVQQKLALLISNPISEEELYAIVKTMATNKAPGPDGISIEFYQRYWQIIKQDFTVNDQRDPRFSRNSGKDETWYY